MEDNVTFKSTNHFVNILPRKARTPEDPLKSFFWSEGGICLYDNSGLVTRTAMLTFIPVDIGIGGPSTRRNADGIITEGHIGFSPEYFRCILDILLSGRSITVYLDAIHPENNGVILSHDLLSISEKNSAEQGAAANP